MKPSIVQGLADALGLWRRERDLVTRVAGVFFVVPTFALTMALPDRDAATAAAARAGDSEAQAQFLAAYLVDNAHWLAAHAAVELFGAGVLMALFLHPDRPSVGQAIGIAARRFPTLLMVAILGGLAMLGGLILFFVPGFYAIGRFFVANAVVLAEPARGVGDSVARGIALTRRHGFGLFAVAAAIFLAGQIGGTIVGAFGALVTAATGPGGVGGALAMLLLSVVAAAVSSAFVLSRIALYRRLAASRG